MKSCTLNTEKQIQEYIKRYINQQVYPRSNDGTDIKAIKKYLRMMLANIGDNSQESDLDNITNWVNQVFNSNEEYMDFQQLLPKEGIRNAMSKTYRAMMKNNKDISLENIDETESDFLDYKFGVLFDIKRLVKTRALNILLESFIINRTQGRLISSTSDMNTISKEQKQKLLDNIVLGVQLYDSEGNYTGVFESEARKFGLIEDVIETPEKIERLYKSNTEMFNKAIDLFILKNFDNFVNLLLDSVIEIKEDGTYDYKQVENNLITTWRTSENVDLTKEINKLTQYLINTTPLYENGVKTDKFIRFEDFCIVMTKLKNYNNNKVINTIGSDAFGESISSLVAKTQENPIKYYKLLMEEIIKTDTSNYFSPNEQDILRSVYEGIFNQKSQHSILGITRSQNDYRLPNYYNLIVQSLSSMYSVEYLQFYQNEDGSIEVRNLRMLNQYNIRRALETSILQTNSRQNRYNYKENLQEYLVDGNFVGVVKTFKLQDGSVLEIKRGKDLYEVKLNGESYNRAKFYPALLSDPIINNFIKQYLNIDLNDDSVFKTALIQTFEGNRGEGYAVFEDLIQLASEIMFNKYLSNVTFKDKRGKSELEEVFTNFYNVGAKPKFNYLLNEPNLMSDGNLPILEKIASAKAKLFGQALTTIVKGSDGEGLNTTTLSRLLGSITSQHHRIKQNINNAAAEFSILKPGFKVGSFTTKDFKGISENKDITKFSVAELFNGFFLQQFVGRGSSGKVVGGGIAGFLPSVNSDKNTISSDLYDMNFNINGKSLEQMTVEEINLLICKELGDFYTKQLNKVHNDLATLGIDYTDNFTHFNAKAKDLGKTPYAYAMELCLAYNQQHPQSPISLIDQTHFINVGGNLKSNNTVNALINRYNNPNNLTRFMQFKYQDILEELTSDNITVDLTQDNYISNYLSTKYPEWVGKTNANNGFMTLAIVTAPNGTQAKITTAQDLKFFLKNNNLSSVRDLQVKLHPELEKYNALDYLITQESQLAGVGTHTNHKGKVKLETGAIFNYQEDNFNIVNYDSVAKQMLDQGVSSDTVFGIVLGLATQANKILETKLEQLKPYCSNDLTSLLIRVEENEISEEAARFLAQHKRNVSWTAAMHMFLPNQVSGPPVKYNMAIMDDILFNLYTIHGNRETTKPFDGATFSNPFIVYLENFALNGDAAGIDKKPFVHFYDAATGTGGIIKNATFGVTNNRCRDDKFYRIMMKQMCDRKWFDQNGQPYIAQNKGILQDFEGNAVDYGIFYFKRGSKYYAREILEYQGNNQYTIRTAEVNQEGVLISDPVETIVTLDTNYAVWDMFGGYNSMELDQFGLLDFSEKSIQLTVKAMIGFGEKLNDVVETAEDVYQPMKYSDIHYMPTIGAVKQGAANINSNRGFYNLEEILNWMQVEMWQAGIQLDKSHEAEDSYLSLMTQVISGAASKGYTLNQSSKLYQALYELTKLKTKEFRDELGVLNPEVFDAAASNLILKHIISNTSSTDGTLLQVIAQELIQQFKDNKNLVLDKKFAREVDKHIPYSDSRIYRKILNVLTSTLTKKGIKQTIPGNLAVLNPTQDIIKFYKAPVLENGQVVRDSEGNIQYKKVRYGQLEDYFDLYGVGTEEAVLESIESELINSENSLRLIDVEIGNYYNLVYTNGNTETVKIEMPHSIINEGKTINGIRVIGYQDLKNVIGNVAKIIPSTKYGEDLQSYNVRFNDTDGKAYQLADLDIVQDYFKSKDYSTVLAMLRKHNYIDLFIDYVQHDLSQSKFQSMYRFLEEFTQNPEEAINIVYKYSEFDADSMAEYLEITARKILNICMQNTLNGISKNSSVNTVLINDKPVTINKSSIKTQAYGLVMPAIYRGSLGLSKRDDVQTIKQDPLFFTKHLAVKFNTKISSYEDFDGNIITNFNLELKRANGKHVYIKVGKDGLGEEFSRIEILKETDEEGNIYRIDANGNRLYQLSSDSDQIYVDESGNEVIVVESDKTTWTDSSGNIINVTYKDKKHYVDDVEILKAGDSYVNSKNGEEVFKNNYSGIQFYLDNFDYESIYINKHNDDKMFKTILRHLKNSSNDTAILISRIIKNDKNISDQLENFENPSEEIKWFVDRLIGYHGTRIHNSFIKSLNIIAARIPAQNQQSFMGMEIQDFEDNNINSAYVSSFQFFLQGSDLDVDAVSLQVFKLNKQGLFVGHSPYYSLNTQEQMEESSKIPFPTGQDLTINSDGNPTLETLFDYFKVPGKMTEEDKLLEGLFGISGDGLLKVVKTGEYVSLKFDLRSVNNIRQLVTLIEMLNRGGFTKLRNIPRFIEDFNSVYGVVLSDQNVLDIEEQLIELVNKHNNYVKKANFNKKAEISQNYMTQQLYDIITDPINQLEAQSSVDVITGPYKSLAKTSKKAKIQSTFTPGNFVNKFKSITENMVGKDGIAICATGLKAFFALTQTYNQTMSKDSIHEKEALLCSVKIGGKVYKGLANVVGEVVDSESLKDYLFEQFVTSDMANEMSAMLSLSTDNAKELVLDKINANTYTLGMYLYGLSLGVPFKTMYQIMTSDFALRITELVKGNIFNSKQVSIRTIDEALKYISNGPTFNYVNDPISTLKINDLTLLEFVKNSVNNNVKLDNIVTAIEQLRGQIYSNPDESYQIEANQYLDAMQQYASDLYLKERSFYDTVYGTSKTSYDFELLTMGASELKTIGRICSVNQGIRDMIGQISTIETLIDQRIRQIKSYKNRGNRYDDSKVVDSELKKAIQDKYSKATFKFSLKRFLTETSYANEKIALYDQIKMSYNPLRILRDVAHYKGYAETLLLSQESIKSKSLKFVVSTSLAEQYAFDWKITNPKLKEQLTKNIEQEISRVMRDSWLRNLTEKEFAPIVLKPGINVFIDDATKQKPLNYSMELKLGTILGNANYKVWFEEVVIPNLKKKYPNNKFIKSLDNVINTGNTSGMVVSHKGLPGVNMLPETQYEKDLLNDYRTHFNDLNDIYDKWMIKDLFYIYSLIVNGDRIGPTSLQNIFQDYALQGLAAKFIKYEISQDRKVSNENFVKEFKSLLDPLAFRVFASPYQSGVGTFKQFNRDSEEVTYWTTADEHSEYVVNGHAIQSSPTVKGFNTSYFINSVRKEDLVETTKIKLNNETELLVTTEGKVVEVIGDSKILQFIKQNYGGVIPTKSQLKDGKWETTLILDELNDLIESIKGCNA